jgi:hypothetical protein
MENNRNRAWLLLAGLLVGLGCWSGTASAAPAPSDQAGSCATGGNEVTLPSGATASVCDEAPVATNAAGLHITLSKTVGTDRGTCASTTEITVTSSVKEAVYCYTVTNDGDTTATSHDLVDDRLGTLLSNYSFSLAPGASTFATAAANLTGQGPVVINVGTWTAHAGGNQAQAQAQAKVTIIDGPTAPTPITATPNEGGARVTWTTPSSNGGQVITGYRVTPVDGGTPGTPITTNASTFAHDFTGLTNGHTYRFDVAAITANGDGLTGQSAQVSPQWWRPWTSANKAVTEISTWLTGKAPTTAQLNAFVASANSSGKLPGDLVASLRDGTDAVNNVDPVVRLYSAYFLRPPDPSGLNYYLGKRRSGSTLASLSNIFVASNEFKTRYGSLSNEDYVKLVYQNVLGRQPDANGLQYWTKQLNTNKKSRGQVMLSFSDSNEYKTKRATYVDAVSIYLQFLGKYPTSTQVDDMIGEINDSSIPAVIRVLVHQASFDDRAG